MRESHDDHRPPALNFLDAHADVWQVWIVGELGHPVAAADLVDLRLYLCLYTIKELRLMKVLINTDNMLSHSQTCQAI